MDIVAALFVEAIEMRAAFEGGPTLIDLGGVHFSTVPPSPPPVTVAPHLVVFVRCPQGEPGNGVLEVVFRRDGEQVARNVQPLQVDPGKFTYRLVRAEVDFDDYGTVEAHCRIGTSHVTVVPYTLVKRP
ncbi:MAG TPA: hypothetical protein VE623_24530 [Acidimicrobiales bacterium]|jgi:hypothetical protein|nr:hypothetical protein [Acidimicrobiales bacterium]